MIRGRFGNTTGRPYIEGRLTLTRLGIRGDVSFLIDTGADVTMLAPADALKLGVDYATLNDVKESIGIGGISQCFREDALVGFVGDNQTLYVHDIRVSIPEMKPALLKIPSLLGRDVLNRWRMTYDAPRSKISSQVIKADYVYPVPTTRKKKKY